MEKTKIIKNTSNLDIINYPIAEARIDEKTGEAKVDTGTGQYLETGTTLTWSIRAGETLEFPKYVADYLLGIYDFLEEVEEKKYETKKEVVEETVKKKEAVEPSAKEVKEDPSEFVQESKESEEKEEELPEGACPVCKRQFDSDRGLVMHMASKHRKEIKGKF